MPSSVAISLVLWPARASARTCASRCERALLMAVSLRRRHHRRANRIARPRAVGVERVSGSVAARSQNRSRYARSVSRIIVYTGKGGVGKTSVAAATALRCAERGQRTLVISTDIAHSLADSFDVAIGGEPTRIADNLWGQESDVYYNVRRYWGTIQRYVQSVFQWRGLDDVLAEEMTVLPGMDELASLLWIAEHHDSGSYEVIVVDAAPTGETVRLLSLPEAGRWWLERIFPLQRRAMQIAGPVIRRVMGMPVPDDTGFSAGEELF